MKTKTLVLRHWEDVVFENRNRDYGAYVLRKTYSKRVILGWGITVALFAALLYITGLSLPDASSFVQPWIPEKTGTLTVQPPPVFQDRPKPIQQQPQNPKTSTAQVIVTTDHVETTAEPLNNFTGSSDDTGTAGAVDGYVDGTVSAPVDVPVVITPPVVRDFAEVMPQFNGGYEAMMKFIKKKVRVPASFRFLEEGGTVYVRFVIDPAGKVTNVEVVRGLSRDCDKEAARVIGIMPTWIAGMQNGTPVPVRMVIPIRFAKE